MRAREDLQVVVAGDVVGRVLLAEHGGDLVVLEARLASPGHAAVLDALLTCRAIATGSVAVVLDGDDDPRDGAALGALAETGGYEVASQRLRLDLTGELPAEAGVRLAPMGEEAVADLRGRLSDEHAALLPVGPGASESSDQHLSTGWAGSSAVGHLWLDLALGGAAVRVVEVAVEERRRGHGAAILRAGALWVRAQGRNHLDLDVSRQDVATRALVARLGYVVTRTTYRRPVTAG